MEGEIIFYIETYFVTFVIDRFNFFFPFGGIYHVYRMVNDPFQASSFVKQRTGFTAISIKKG